MLNNYNKRTNEHTCKKFWQVIKKQKLMKGQSEIADMPIFNNNIFENSQTLVNG